MSVNRQATFFVLSHVFGKLPPQLNLVVNAMLIAINFISSPEDIWFFYPLIGKGISLHYLFSVRWIQKELKEREAKGEYKAREAKKK